MNEEKEVTPAEVATDHVGLTTTVPDEDTGTEPVKTDKSTVDEKAKQDKDE